MESKLLLITVMMAFLVSCQSGSDNESKKEELKKVWNAFYDALVKKDIQALNSLTTSNFVMYDEGVIYNNESAVKAMEEMGAFTASFSFDSVNAYVDKSNASAYCLREARFTFPDSVYPPVRFLESATFWKESGKWKLRFLHSTVRK